MTFFISGKCRKDPQCCQKGSQKFCFMLFLFLYLIVFFGIYIFLAQILNLFRPNAPFTHKLSGLILLVCGYIPTAIILLYYLFTHCPCKKDKSEKENFESIWYWKLKNLKSKIKIYYYPKYSHNRNSLSGTCFYFSHSNFRFID